MEWTGNNMIDGDRGSDCFSPYHNDIKCPKCNGEYDDSEEKCDICQKNISVCDCCLDCNNKIDNCSCN